MSFTRKTTGDVLVLAKQVPKLAEFAQSANLWHGVSPYAATTHGVPAMHLVKKRNHV